MNKREALYKRHRKNISGLFHSKDILFILTEPLISHFDALTIQRIRIAGNDIVKVFFDEFEKIQMATKYIDFIHVSADVSEWIAAFFISEDDGEKATDNFITSLNLINQNSEFFIDNLTFDCSVIKKCVQEKLITSRTQDLLEEISEIDGELIAKHRFYSLLHVHSLTCYAKFLYLCHQYNPLHLELFYIDVYELIQVSTSDEEIKDCIGVISTTHIDTATFDRHISDPTPVTRMVSSQSELSTLGSFPSDPSSTSADQKATADSDDNIDDNEDTKDDLDFLFGACKDKDSREMLNFRSENVASSELTLKMREYQTELAVQGIEGKNVLICAPTSSGKTVVAIKIADEHMKMKPAGKVALVVPTTVLVDQQFNLFQKYIGTSYRINKLIGGAKSSTVPLSVLLPDYDIFVLTCDILKNALEDTEEPLESISRFSLIIFDECHHCDKDHPYNKVMDHYFNNKQQDQSVPQIIGMTASTGTDKAKCAEAALNNLLSLCANLDSFVVSTVIINVEELNKNLPTPSNQIQSPGSRLRDTFEDSLLELMDKIELLVNPIFASKNLKISIPPERYHDKYLSFVKGLNNCAQDSWSDEEKKGVKILEIYLENLYRALIINHLFNFVHAKEMLKDRIDRKSPYTCDLEKTLRSLLNDFLSSDSLEQDANPSLECLKQEIVSQIKEDRKSKIIVFVKEVFYTKILETEIRSARLGFVSCRALVGTNKSSDQGGLTKSETEEIVTRFRQGIINLIFATSVAEEGLDVEKCNLVVRYGHVTNEISMVQCRGRARAANSKYVVIVPHKMQWQVNKENVNKIRETMMYQAIEMFQGMDLEVVKRRVFEQQEKRHTLRRVSLGNSNAESGVAKVEVKPFWELQCCKCLHYICSSEDIRLANGTSYININKHTYANVSVTKRQANNHPIVCNHCQVNLGYLIKVEGIKVPTIKISQCVLKSGNESVKTKKWKEVPFSVPKVVRSDLIECQSDAFNQVDM